MLFAVLMFAFDPPAASAFSVGPPSASTTLSLTETELQTASNTFESAMNEFEQQARVIWSDTKKSVSSRTKALQTLRERYQPQADTFSDLYRRYLSDHAAPANAAAAEEIARTPDAIFASITSNA